MNKDFEKFYRSRHPFGMSFYRDYTKKMSGGIISPYIIEEHAMNVAQMDVFSRLMKDRQIMFGTDVNSDSANIIVSQLLYLNSVSDEEITMYVNSPGGSVYDGNGILDTMAYIKADVRTICTGLAASMGSMILMCGTRGKRSALPMSRVMIHQVSSGIGYINTADLKIEYDEMKSIQNTLYGILAENTGKTIEQIEKDADRNHWFTAQDALEYCLIDKIIRKK